MAVKDKLKEQVYENVIRIDEGYLQKNILELRMAIAIRPNELSTYRHITVKLQLLLIMVLHSIW